MTKLNLNMRKEKRSKSHQQNWHNLNQCSWSSAQRWQKRWMV